MGEKILLELSNQEAAYTLTLEHLVYAGDRRVVCSYWCDDLQSKCWQ